MAGSDFLSCHLIHPIRHILSEHGPQIFISHLQSTNNYWPGSQTHYDRHTFSSSKSYSEQVTKDRNTMPQALSRYGQVHSVESILKQSSLLWPNVQQFHVNQHFIFTAHCLFYHLLHCAGDGTHGLHTLQ